jgi:hypothetical protein
MLSRVVNTPQELDLLSEHNGLKEERYRNVSNTWKSKHLLDNKQIKAEISREIKNTLD